MSSRVPPLVVEPAELEKHLGAEDLLVVDVGPAEVFEEVHVPGAVHLDLRDLSDPPPIFAHLHHAQSAWLPGGQGLSEVVG